MSANTANNAGNLHVIDAPARAGRQWISAAWAMFIAQPGGWISLMSCWIILSLLASVGIPFAGREIVVMLQPGFFAGFVIAARDQQAGGAVTFSHLFAGMRFNGRALLLLGAVILLARSVLVLAVNQFDFPAVQPIEATGIPDMFGFFRELDALQWTVLCVSIVATMLIDGVLWFAVPLLALHPMRTDHAIRWSVFAFLGNFLPMMLFAMMLVCLVMIGSLPLGLGMLFVMPVYALTHYTSYRQVFRED